MNTLSVCNGNRRPERGISLIIVLIMLIIIGITASTAMRNATSSQRATNNLRVEASALQYAEAALRFCENELLKADALRVPTLREVYIPVTSFTILPGPITAGWEDPATWTGAGGIASATRTEVLDTAIKNSTDTVLPNKKPECVVERMTGYGTVVTARGFSPDYTKDGAGKTITGAVVWLQSFIN